MWRSKRLVNHTVKKVDTWIITVGGLMLEAHRVGFPISYGGWPLSKFHVSWKLLFPLSNEGRSAGT
jgi:hypothetical protein